MPQPNEAAKRTKKSSDRNKVYVTTDITIKTINEINEKWVENCGNN